MDACFNRLAVNVLLLVDLMFWLCVCLLGKLRFNVWSIVVRCLVGDWLLAVVGFECCGLSLCLICVVRYLAGYIIGFVRMCVMVGFAWLVGLCWLVGAGC